MNNTKEFNFLQVPNGKGDFDNRKESVEVYKVLYDFLDEIGEKLCKFGNNNESMYRGETLNSFNTMVGCLIRGSIYFKDYINVDENGNELNGTNYDFLVSLWPDVLDECNEIYKSLSSDIDLESFSKETKTILNSDKPITLLLERFNEIHHSHANFLPLINTSYNKQTLNQFKGKRYNIKDFTDAFLENVKKVYCSSNPEEVDDFLKNVDIIEYFKSFGTGNEGWKVFVESNFLQDFFEDKDYQKLIKLKPSGYMLYRKNSEFHKKLIESEELRKEYYQEIIMYFINATRIIEQRAQRLEKAYSELVNSKNI